MSETSSQQDQEINLIDLPNTIAEGSGDEEEKGAPPKQTSQTSKADTSKDIQLELPGHLPDNLSSWTDPEDDDNDEKLRLIKAKTMFEMVEEFDDGNLKVLFLTNSQASLMASDNTCLNNMFNALEIGKPNLLINLLMSYGFAEGTNLWLPNDIKDMNARMMPGVVATRAPFASPDDEYAAEARVDMFMTEVLIPLAAKTNALVLCDAISKKCYLSRSFMRMVQVAKARWGGKLPFTVLSVVEDTMSLYRNTDETTHWRYVRDQSRAWRQRDAKIEEVALRGKSGDRDGRHDIDSNARCVLIADNVDVVKDKEDKVSSDPVSYLRDALVRNLGTSVPTLSLKTGGSFKAKLGTSAGTTLQRPSDLAQHGECVVFLDVRARDHRQLRVEKSNEVFGKKVDEPNPLLAEAMTKIPPKPKSTSTRPEMIEFFKAHMRAWDDNLKGLDLAETFDACSLAFLHDCLTSDGVPDQTGDDGEAKPPMGTALYEAIRLAKEGSPASKPRGDGSFKRRAATTEEIAEAVEWLSQRIFSYGWSLLHDREEREANGETYRERWKAEMVANSTYMRMLLASPAFHSANLYDMDDVSTKITRLVCLDRLPGENPLEGLLLLRSAWCDFDVSMMLAGRYKLICKVLFALQLILGLCVIFGSLFSNYYKHAKDDEDTAKNLLQSAFGISLAITFLVSLEGQLNPKARWKALRSSAHSLQSTIWQYRTRVGPFELDASNRDSTFAETTLCSTLNEWRDSLVSSAGLKETGIKRKYPERVYRHLQNQGELEEGADDFQSPVQPTRYIALRVQSALAFYKRRIPIYTRRVTIFKTLVGLIGAASSLLAHYKESMWVAVATAGAATITSWSEFSDSAQKVERYSKSIVGLEKVLSWWDSLSEVQKASKDNISQLVLTCESIISEEMLSWTTAGAKAKEKDKDGEGEDTEKPKALGA